MPTTMIFNGSKITEEVLFCGLTLNTTHSDSIENECCVVGNFIDFMAGLAIFERVESWKGFKNVRMSISI